MRAALSIAAIAFAVAAFVTPAKAAPLPPDQRWVVLASRQNVDEAIGIARFYHDFSQVHVMRSDTGWYAVVVGPERVTMIEQFKQHLESWQSIPKDTYLSRGDHYRDEVWHPAKPELAQASLQDVDKAELHYRDLTVTLSRTGPVDATIPSIVLAVAGQTKYRWRGDADQPAAQLGAIAVMLDKTSPQPQIVTTRYTGGAHCCTDTTILTAREDGAWRAVPGETLDGDGGYGFDDIAGDGNIVLLNYDDSFLYAFACYACSYAPLEIHRLEGTALRDITHTAAAHRRLTQSLYGMEYAAQVDPDLWHANGFLGAWVATKALVGQFDDAWASMLTKYDRQSDWDMSVCPNDADKCDDKLRVKVSFPEALWKHLLKGQYIDAAMAAAIAGK